MTDEEKDWKHWNSLESFRLYEAIYLQKGILPPKDIRHLANEEERNDWYHDIYTMADFDDDFIRLLSQLRADSRVGKEFRDITENTKAAFHYIEKAVFVENWKKSGFRTHKKFTIEKQRQGRPKKVDIEKLSVIAKECIAYKKAYPDFIKTAKKEFSCSPGRVRELFSAKSYKALQNF